MKNFTSVFGLSCCLLLISCFPTKSEDTQKHNQPKERTKAKQITINELGTVLSQLSSGETEYDFVGITSNGTDCVYVVRNGTNFDLEFEAMTEAQLPFIDQLQRFAVANGYRTQMTTFGNKPNYDRAEAPVIQIMTATSLDSTVILVEKLQKEIFSNDQQTIYDVVP